MTTNISRGSKIVKIAFFIATYWLVCNAAWAGSISSTELINDAKRYDGKAVTYSGEVIGDVMKRGDYAWVNVSDGVNAIGIWVTSLSSNDIAYTGTYKTKGDSFEVTGIFHRACIEHGGDLDIHASAIRKISTGAETLHRFDFNKLKMIGILLVAVFALALLPK